MSNFTTREELIVAGMKLALFRRTTVSITSSSKPPLGKKRLKKKKRGGGKRRGEESGETKGVRQQQQPPLFSTTPDELPLHYPSTNTGERTSWWKNGRGKREGRKGIGIRGQRPPPSKRRVQYNQYPFGRPLPYPPFAAGVFPGGYLGHDNLEEAPEERESECAGMIKGCCCWCNPKRVLELLAMRNVCLQQNFGSGSGLR
ncbi:hypothetical protein CEXT_678341 [Caerostris extrusa]|uniref:Uncharacterized protein n=1 Tax=Caerostris extrusa TaxID=172846 RepID=A0AAV4VPU0_CAEEX|nr:hypothetical protein CEXT_678341 [Caerostris extrusa]